MKDIPGIVGALREALGLEMRDRSTMTWKDKRDAKWEQQWLEQRASEFQSIEEVKKYFRPDYGVDKINAAVGEARTAAEESGKAAKELGEKYAAHDKLNQLEKVMVKDETNPEKAEENKNTLEELKAETDPYKRKVIETQLDTEVRTGVESVKALTTNTNAKVKLASRVSEAEQARQKQEDKITKRSQEELKKLGKFKEGKEKDRKEGIASIVSNIGDSIKDVGKSIQYGRNMRHNGY